LYKLKLAQFFSSKTIYPKRTLREFNELISFNIIIPNDENLDFKDQEFILNNSLLPKLYKQDIKSIQNNLEIIFSY